MVVDGEGKALCTVMAEVMAAPGEVLLVSLVPGVVLLGPLLQNCVVTACK